MLQVSQTEFAKQLSATAGRSIHPTQLSKWERARFRPPYDVLISAARLAGVPLDDLMDAAASGEPVSSAQVVGAARPARPIADPRQMLLDLLELGFALPEAIALVKRARSGK
jgi:transcriptional regulator with XRE-family HTH domain